MEIEYFMGSQHMQDGAAYPGRRVDLTINGEAHLLEHMSDERLARWRPVLDRCCDHESLWFIEPHPGNFGEDQFVYNIELAPQAFYDELARRAHRREIEAALAPSSTHAAQSKGGRL